MESIYVSYALIEVGLIMFAFVIYSNLNMNIGSEYEVKRLKNIIAAFEVVLVTDIFWAFTEAQIIMPSRLLNAAVNGISISAVTVGCYYWFDYVVNRSGYMLFDSKVKRLLEKIPLFITVFLNLISIFTEWVFVIDENGHYTYGSLFIVQVIGTYVYLLAATVIALWKLKRPHSRIEQKEYIAYSLYMLPPLVTGFIEDLFPSAPILYMCMFFAILIVFTTIQNLQIFNDALTGLNNRKRLELYLQEIQNSATVNNPISVFMIDVDKFKEINDTYGHVEGDTALKIIADCLKITSKQLGGFVARYGGDEFCYVLSGREKEPEFVKECIRKNLKELQIKMQPQREYSLAVSIGYNTITDSESDIVSSIEKADMLLYADKKREKKRKIKSFL